MNYQILKIQNQTIIQILDPPLIPIRGSGKNIKLITIFGGFMGLMIGIVFAFIRSLLKNADMVQKKEILEKQNPSQKSMQRLHC